MAAKIASMQGKSEARIWLAVLGALCAVCIPTGVWAHGGGAPQLTGEEAGPYRLYAWTSPDPWRAGDVHIDIAVAQPALQGAEVPVTDASVRLRLTGPDNGQPIEMVAQPLEILNSFYYEADFELPAPGLWQVDIQVATPDGEGSAGFTVEALPPRTVNWLLVGGGALVFVAATALWAMWSNPGNAPQSRQTGTEATKHVQ
jgi:hypothetical protein